MNSLYVREKESRSVLLIVSAMLAAFVINCGQAHADDVPQSFTLDGRLFSDAAGTTALSDSNIGFKVQILDDDQLCVLYEERQIVNTASSQGYFSIQVGTSTGDARRTAGDSANSMATVFQNITTVTGKLLSNGATCNVPPTGGKRRYVRIVIAPSTMGGTERTLSPNLTIDSVPNSVVAERAETLQGLRGNDFLKVNTASGSALSQNNLESLFTSVTRFNALSSIVDGTSTSYMRSNSASGAQLPVITGAPTAPGAGSLWYDTTDQKLKYQTGTGPVSLGTGGGSVTSVGLTAPSELSVSGGPITSSGSITVAWASQSANRVFASPNGSAGTPSFRALVAADVTGVVENAGTTPSVQSGLDAGKGAPDPTKVGRLYIAYDAAKIYRDSGSAWVVISSDAGGGVPSGSASGDLSGSYPGPTVAKIQGYDVNTTAPSDGQVLKYIGSATNKWTASNFSIGDLKTAAGAQQFSGSTACTAAQTLTWSSLTDTFTCSNIALAGTAITSGTIDAARLPASFNVPYTGAFQINGTDVVKIITGPNVAYSNLFVGSPSTTVNTASAWANTTLGMSAGDSITDGYHNTLLGWNSGTAITTGNSNTFVGTNSGIFTTTGYLNTGIGMNALINNVAGNSNVAIGQGAGQDLVGGNSNILIGTGAQASATTAYNELNIGDLILGDLTAANRKLDVNGALNQRGMAAAAAGLSTAGQGRIYFDSTSNKFRVSQNGGAYVDLVSTGTGDVVNGGNTVAATMSVGTANNYTFNLKQNNATRLSILDNGNMSINGGTPTGGNATTIGGGTASGFKSVAIGDTATPSGGQSIAIGMETYAPSISQLTVGTNNRLTGTEDANNWVATDPLFVVGNGTAWNARSNALMIYKNGKMTINGGSAVPSAPSSTLDLNGDMSIRGMAAPAVSAAGQGRIYFDSTSNKFRVSQNGVAYTDLIGGATSMATNDGTNAAPSYSFSSDPNTGMYSSGPDELSFTTGGVQNFWVNGGGVGLQGNVRGFVYSGDVYSATGATALPDTFGFSSINSNGTTGAYNTVRLQVANGSATTQGSYLGAVSTASGYAPAIVIGQQTGASAYTERLRIDESGNVGIGAPSPGAKLDVTDTSTTTSAVIVPRAGNFTGTNVNGMIRYNTTSTLFEFRQNGAWVNYTTVSDGRLKTNVQPVTHGLDIVNQLNPVFYDWDRRNPKATSFEDKHQVGFIAQEVEKVLPEVVNKGEDSYRSLEYGKIVSVVVAAVQELYKELMNIKEEQAALRLENAQLKQENAEIKARLEKIEKAINAK